MRAVDNTITAIERQLRQQQARWSADAKRAWRGMSFFQMLYLRIGGTVSAGIERLTSDPEIPATRMYYFYCSEGDTKDTHHGIQKSYRQGFRHQLRCPVCEAIWLAPKPAATSPTTPLAA